MMYNSTPHLVIAKMLSELFLKRQFMDKLPSTVYLENLEFNQQTRDTDQIQKEKGKEYGDSKQNANKGINVKIGDKVYEKK